MAELNSNRITRRTRAIAFIASLLLFAGQLNALVHAAEHPFHADDEICATFASFDHNNHALAVLPPSNESTDHAGELTSRLPRLFIDHAPLCHQARAPPLSI